MDAVEKRIVELIDGHRDEIIAFARDVYTHAELGYKEYRTAEKFAGTLKKLGLEVKEELAITGIKGYLNPEKSKTVSLALIGELDALRIPSHPYANAETGAAHCCGHHAQLAGVIGAAIALSSPEVSEKLDGQVVFYAVPAEEYGEIEFKNRLKDEGRIKYGGGKCELIRIGEFDDISLGVVHHTGRHPISVGSGTNNGFVSKVIRYIGREAHAGGAPEKGINALNAASLGLSALAYQRETFRDDDSVRIHPIITKGGNLVNVVPNEVVIETLVRAANAPAILDADRKAARAFKFGAFAVGAGYEITTMPGYLPTLPQPAHPAVLGAAGLAAPDAEIIETNPAEHSGGSTDVGDLQHIMPILKFQTGGVSGNLHSDKFEVVDEELAYIVTAKIFALSAYRLLRDGAAEAGAVVENYRPRFTKAEYLSYMDSLIRVENLEPENPPAQ